MMIKKWQIICEILLFVFLYSSDLAASDYFLFPNLKKWLGGKRFGSNEEVITETNAYFEGLEKTYYLKGIKNLGAGLEFKMLKTTKVQSSGSNIAIDKFYDLSFQQRCI